MNQLMKKIFLSTIVGFIYLYAVKLLWAYIPNINPITSWLFSCCASEPWFLSAIKAQDIIINILLCIPLAIFLIKLKSEQPWLLVFAALIPSFIFSNIHLFQPEYSGWNLSHFAFSWSIELLCLPIALVLTTFLANRENT